MLKILMVTVSLKARTPDVYDYANYERDLRASAEARFQTEQLSTKQLEVLDDHLDDGWDVLHVSDVEDAAGFYNAYTLRKARLDDDLVMLTADGLKALEAAR